MVQLDSSKPALHHRHAVLCEGASLVAADGRRTAHCLTRRKHTHKIVVLCVVLWVVLGCSVVMCCPIGGAWLGLLVGCSGVAVFVFNADCQLYIYL